VKPLQDQAEYLSKRDELVLLLVLAQAGYIELCFGDESGFSLLPTVPYGWIKRGQSACILSQRSARLNVFGLLSTHHQLTTYQKQESITTEFVIECLDDFAQSLSKPTVVVLDNAPMHKSVLFQAKQAEWEAKGLSIFFLPKYSPHLNRIERLWKQIKCHWLKAQDYLSFEQLKKAVNHILAHFGTAFTLQFKELDFDENLIFNFD
jgi:transposase